VAIFEKGKHPRTGLPDSAKTAAPTLIETVTQVSQPVADDQAYRQIATVLDSLDALIYVADMTTHELLFINSYGRKIWGDTEGLTCWQVLQAGQTGPCSFCTNDRLVDEQGRPNEVHVWEVQNSATGSWYQCRDQAIRWVDGRLVRLEIATDITERKEMELALEAAKRKAEALSRTDDLTGLYNRRAFFDMAYGAFKHACRFGRKLAAVVIDLDDFKHINDSYGHQAGDRVLQALSSCIQENVREVDLVGRIGGEEFALVLPETSSEEAAGLAERLRSAVEELRVGIQGLSIGCTASLGVSSLGPGVETLETLISCADASLYAAKRGGRNRVVVTPEA